MMTPEDMRTAVRLRRLGQSAHAGRLRGAHAGAVHARPGLKLSLGARHTGAHYRAQSGCGSNASRAARQAGCPRRISFRISRACALAGRKSSASFCLRRMGSRPRISNGASIITDLKGNPHSNVLWQTLQHLANHGTYHRGQVTTLLRQLGAKPVGTDLIGFYRERAAQAAH